MRMSIIKKASAEPTKDAEKLNNASAIIKDKVRWLGDTNIKKEITITKIASAKISFIKNHEHS